MNSKVKDGNQNISAFVRVRPFNSTEKHRSVVDILSGNEICVKDNKQHSASKSYTFNQVFGSKSSQIEVYKSVVSPLINEVLSGYNCTVFAYGQTGTGKTFTMEGERSSDCNVLWETDSLAGIVPRTLSQLFDELRILDSDFTVKVSFLELYNEELIDLLSPPDDTTKLKIFEDSSKKGSVIISGLEEVSVPHKSAVYQILERGSIKRQTAATLLNAHSSRSHTVFTVTVHMRLPSVDGEDVMRTGKMNLVDLAGSENIGRSGAVKHRAREAGNINQSLLTLGRVITALADQSPHVPYRESKLTRILQESLGGRTKTSIIATVSPSASNLEETISTLEYAHRAKKIKNRPEVNQKFCKKTVLKEYSAEIERLQRDLEATQLRSGIFLDQAEYDDLILILDQLEADIKSRAQEQAALQEEMEKMMGVCDELSNEVKNVEESVQERTAVCEEQKVALSGLKAKTTGVVIDAVEKSYLLKHHMETLQQLTSQTDVIRQTTMNSVANAELLSDKVDRARNASLLNQTSIEDFVAKSNSIFDDAVDIIEGEMKTVSHDAQDLKSELNKALLEVDSHISNTQSAASAFSLIDEQCINFRSTLTNADLQDTELRSKMSSLLPKFPSAGSAHIENLSSLAKEYVKATEESLGDIDNKITELKTFYDLTTLQVIEDIPKCVESRSAQLEKVLNCASKRAQNACKILDDIKQEDNSFYDSYFDLLEKMEQKYAAMQKLASEIQSLQLESLQLVESHEHNEKIKVDAVLAEVAEASSLCNADFDEEESLLALIQSQVERNLELLSEQVEHLAAKCVINLPFLPMDIIILKEREVKDAFSQFLSDVNDCLKEDVTASKQLASVFSTYSKESEVTMTTICNDVKTHIGLLTSTLENLRKNTPNKLMAIVTRMSSFLTQFKEKMDEYENAVEHVLQFGAKPASPTGKTPVRSKLNIPRNLAATSPHERILSRLRSKYKSDINLETLSDCAFSDLESDRGLTLDEKENSLVERNEEGNSSKVSMLRKPLSQSN